MANVNSTSGNYTTTFASAFGNLKPQISNQLWWRFGYFCPINALKTMGMYRKVAGASAQHYETGHPVPNFHVGAVITPPAVAGDPIVLTVAAADVVANTVFPAVGETVRFKNDLSGYIETKTFTGGAWRLTIRPWDTSWTLSASAGDGVWMIDQLSAEGSASPNNSKNAPMELVSYPLQIIRNSEEITGSGELTELWNTVDQFGNPITPYYLQTMLGEMRQTTYWSNATFFGHPNFNTANISGNRMYGMDYTISNGGYTQNYNAGLYTLVELQTQARVAMKNSSGNEFFMIGGPDFNFAAQNGLSSVFAQNPIVYEGAGNSEYAPRFQANESELAGQKGIAINIRRVNWGGVHFHWCNVQQFGQTQTGGETGFKQTGYAFCIPLSKSYNVKGTFQNRFNLTVREMQGKSREMQMWSYGGSAPQNKNGDDKMTIEYLSEVGTEYQDISKFQIVKPS